MRVLVVEDEPGIALDLLRALSAAGFAAEHVADGDAAWQRGGVEPFDAAVLDLGLPRMDGLSLIRRWRAEGVGFPILVLSARGAWTTRVEAIDAGADDFLVKPFAMEELLARLRAVLRRREAAHQALAAIPAAPSAPSGKRVRMGRTWLDLDARRLTGADGAEIPLGPSEFALLRAFAERPGRVLTRETLLDLAHPRGDEHFDRSIDVRIARIRRKIEAVPERPAVIKTIRGAGYVFDPAADA
jgi:two-component system phosphate regulon response regulator OmpR